MMFKSCPYHSAAPTSPSYVMKMDDANSINQCKLILESNVEDQVVNKITSLQPSTT